MKKLWLAAGTLLIIFLLTLINSVAISTQTTRITHDLKQAQEAAMTGNWSQAQHLTENAQEQWAKSVDYFYLVLRHSDTDAVHLAFDETFAWLKSRESGAYLAANAQLIAQVTLLADMERPALKNIL